MEGKIKWFDYEKQFGFIEVEGEKDVFVHLSGFANPDLRIVEGDDVKFDVEEDQKGKKAINVAKI